MTDLVNSPAHYNQGTIECIDAMVSAFGAKRVADFCQMNAFKYTWRAGEKGDRVEDLAKAVWYLNRAILLLTGLPTPEPYEEILACRDVPNPWRPEAEANLDVWLNTRRKGSGVVRVLRATLQHGRRVWFDEENLAAETPDEWRD